MKREQPASDHARKVRFMVKKVLSCEQERQFAAFCDPSPLAIPPASDHARKVHFMVKKVHLGIKTGAALRVKTGKRE